MDKTEYRMRLDEINRLVEAQDYEGALAVVDSIEWKRVKSVRTLCMVADIYEVNGELEESMNILKLAYKRSSVGKMILYRQVELALKMKKNDDAVNYYNQYLETAANDTSKYILKYKIYKAQNAPLDEQIAVLEEYKDREYTERWVYELAKLYKKAGKQNKCIENCDDLILWFGEGKYVAKAMEMKMSYVPLTPAQKAKYDSWNKEEKSEEFVRPTASVTTATVSGISAAAMENLQKVPVIPKKHASTEVPSVMDEAAAAKDPMMPVHVDTAQLQEKLAKSFQEVLSGFNRTKVVNAFEALGKASGTELPPEPDQEENMEDYQVTELEPETVNETKISAD
ncbi:MAG: tetratricopeptide repeat protein, partial [Oliverpabstia sp.]